MEVFFDWVRWVGQVGSESSSADSGAETGGHSASQACPMPEIGWDRLRTSLGTGLRTELAGGQESSLAT